MVFKRLIDAWMSFAEKLGDITSSIFLTVFYFTAFSLVSLIGRAAGKKFLREGETPGSTWKKRGREVGDFHKPY
ncbi:MAG: hypothetical protein ABIF01_03145 [Candidatus Micrarchaeota archaeon]